MRSAFHCDPMRATAIYCGPLMSHARSSVHWDDLLAICLTAAPMPAVALPLSSVGVVPDLAVVWDLPAAATYI